MPVTLLTADGKVTRPVFPSAAAEDAFAEEIGEVVQSIRTGKPSTILNGQLACDALALFPASEMKQALEEAVEFCTARTH